MQIAPKCSWLRGLLKARSSGWCARVNEWYSISTESGEQSESVPVLNRIWDYPLLRCDLPGCPETDCSNVRETTWDFLRFA